MMPNFAPRPAAHEVQHRLDGYLGYAYTPATVGAANNSGSANNATSTNCTETTSSIYWQQQKQMAAVSRHTCTPHNYARVEAVVSRASGQARETTLTDLAMQIVQTQLNQLAAAGAGETGKPELAEALSHGPGGAAVVSAAAGAAAAAGGPAKGSALGALILSSRQQTKELEEEEQQRRINEDVNKQFWTALDLSGQGLYHLAPRLFEYDFLQRLYLNHNKLSVVPQSIGKLRQLRVLDLSGNQISELPAELGLVFNLRYLFLFDNQIEHLPHEFGSLFQLEVLGVEGNPLNAHLQRVLAAEGTRGVIIDLREKAPVKLEAPPREWIEVGADSARSGASTSLKHDKFSIMSYNTLCDRYATPQVYGYTPSWALSWPYRSRLLEKELLNATADIVCLQEVDGASYETLWAPLLGQNGYAGVFYPKTRAKTMSEAEKRRVDGCATFYKTSKFALAAVHTIEYNSLALQRTDFKKTADMYNRVMTKDNVAQLVALHTLSGNGSAGGSGNTSNTQHTLIVSNTHLHWDPAFRDVKLVQVALLLEELVKFCGRVAPHCDPHTVPLVVCGDYNSTADSGVVQLFAQGCVGPAHPDVEGRSYGRMTKDGVRHTLGLKSAYADVGELPFTNFTPNFVEVIDYIWYTSSALQVHRVLGPISPEYVRHFVGFPNSDHPSDHIPLVAEFSFKRRSKFK